MERLSIVEEYFGIGVDLMKVAVLDDTGFGRGKPGLSGKELYVEQLASINEEILGNIVVRILLGGLSSSPNTTRIQGSQAPLVIRAISDPLLEERLATVLKREKPDLLHVNVLKSRYPRVIVHAAKSLGMPIVVTMHSWVYVCPTGWSVFLPGLDRDLFPRPRPKCIRCLIQLSRIYGANALLRVCDGFNQTWSLQHLLENSAAVISPSRLLYREVRSLLCIKNLSVLQNPLPQHVLSLHPEYNGDGSVSFFARLGMDKGAQLIPSVAAKLPSVHFHVMGAGPLYEELLQASRRYPNILVHGFVSEEEKYKIVGRSSLVMLPALYMDTFPYTVLEAFALGKPVVSFDWAVRRS